MNEQQYKILRRANSYFAEYLSCSEKGETANAAYFVGQASSQVNRLIAEYEDEGENLTQT